ncbi:winged helix-turn-helix domain-containing protein [Pediococcus acidilactici]
MEYKDISSSTVTEELLREMIMELKDGDQLPSQRELAEKLQVSRNAVKYALARLQKEGDIRVKNRQGIRVNKKIDVNLLGMRPLSSELGESNEQIQQLSAKVINTPNSLESFLKVLPKRTLSQWLTRKCFLC